MLDLMALMSSVYGLTDRQQLQMPFVWWLAYLGKVGMIEARRTLGRIEAARFPWLKGQYDRSRIIRQLNEAAYGKVQRAAPTRSPMTAPQVNAMVMQMASKGRKGKVTFIKKEETDDEED